MAGDLFSDGAESGNLTAWTSNSGAGVTTTDPHSGTYAIDCKDENDYVSKNVGTRTSVYVDFWWKPTASWTGTAGSAVQVLKGNSPQDLLLFYASNKRVYHYTASTVKAYSADNVLTAGEWNHIQWYLTIDNSAGRSVVWVNGNSVLDFTGDTRNSYDDLDIVRFGKSDTFSNSDGWCYIDDVEISSCLPVVITTYDTVSISENIVLSLTGEGVSVNVSDSISVSEMASGVIPDAPLAVSDACTVSEDISCEIEEEENEVNIELKEDKGESVVVSESLDLDIFIDINAVDSCTISEYVSSTVSSPEVSIFDTILVNEDVLVLVSDLLVDSYSESVVSDVINIEVSETAAFSIDLYDEVSCSESVDGLVSDPDVSTYDNIVLAEYINNEVSDLVSSVYDECTVSEYIILLYDSSGIDVVDSIVIEEYLAAEVSALIASVYDDISISEVVVVENTDEGVFISDVISISENLICYIGIEVEVIDQISITDTVDITAEGLVISVYDTSAILDISESLVSDPCVSVFSEVLIYDTAFIEALCDIDIYDEVSCVDVVYTFQSFDISVIDSISIVEDVSVVRDHIIDLYDSISVVDYIVVGYNFLFISIIEDLTRAIDIVTFSWESIASEFDSVTTSESVSVSLRAAWNTADVLTVLAGNLISGTVSSTWSDDGNLLTIRETSATPGYSLLFTFYDIPSYPNFTLYANAWYKGDPNHRIKFYAYNYTTASWEAVSSNTTDIPSKTEPHSFSLNLTTADRVVDGTLLLILEHVTNGKTSHYTYIDKLYLDYPLNINLYIYESASSCIVSEYVEITVSEPILYSYDTVVVSDVGLISISDFSIDVSSDVTLTELVTGIVGDLVISLYDEVIDVEDTVSFPAYEGEVYGQDPVSITEYVYAAVSDIITSVSSDITVYDSIGSLLNIDADLYEDITVSDVVDISVSMLFIDTADTIIAEDVIITEYSDYNVDITDIVNNSDIINCNIINLVSVVSSLSVEDICDVSCLLMPYVYDTLSLSDIIYIISDTLSVNTWEDVIVSENVISGSTQAVGLLILDVDILVPLFEEDILVPENDTSIYTPEIDSYYMYPDNNISLQIPTITLEEING